MQENLKYVLKALYWFIFKSIYVDYKPEEHSSKVKQNKV